MTVVGDEVLDAGVHAAVHGCDKRFVYHLYDILRPLDLPDVALGRTSGLSSSEMMCVAPALAARSTGELSRDTPIHEQMPQVEVAFARTQTPGYRWEEGRDSG